MIRDFLPSDLPAVRDLLLSSGWAERAADPDRLEAVIASATRAVVVDDGAGIIGFGRCVTDRTSNGYLSMIVVDAGHRRRGWGRRIVEKLMGGDPTLTWVLRAGTPESVGFWESLGFSRSSIAFERLRSN